MSNRTEHIFKQTHLFKLTLNQKINSNQIKNPFITKRI